MLERKRRQTPPAPACREIHVSDYRLFVYADGLVLPIIIHLNCTWPEIEHRLMRVFAEELVATRAEVWLGADKVMHMDAAAIAVIVDLANPASPPPQRAALH